VLGLPLSHRKKPDVAEDLARMPGSVLPALLDNPADGKHAGIVRKETAVDVPLIDGPNNGRCGGAERKVDRVIFEICRVVDSEVAE
jgi:hypothetical protein